MFEVVRIVQVHPEANSVDVVIQRTGGRVAGVQVLCGMAAGDHGVSGLMQPAEQEGGKPYDAQIDPARVSYGLMAMAAGMPLLVGFLPPQVAQIMFAEKNRFMWRHPADVYATVKDNADLEVSFPSGTFLRIGAAPAHEDLTGKDYDKKWAIARNLDSAPWVSLSVANAGAAPHTTLTIDPNGNVAFYNAGNVTWHTVGNITAQVDGNLAATVNGTANVHVKGNTTVQLDGNLSGTVNGTTTLHLEGAATLNADSTVQVTAGGAITSSAPVWNHTGPVNITGNVSIVGNLGVAGNIAGTAGGGGGGSATFSGDMHASGTVTGDTDVIAAGKSGKAHTHGGVQPGSGTSGGPS